MKKVNVIFTALTLFGLMTGCGGSGGGNTNTATPAITFTFTHTVKEWMSDGKDLKIIYIGGSGTASIDWGDGSPVETVTLSPITWNDFSNESFWYCETETKTEHNYSQATTYSVRISGENITAFCCRRLNIDSLTINTPTLKELDCSDNKLTTLDISKIPALERLNCFRNPLKNLDVSKNTALKALCSAENQLTTLNVSANTALEELNCSHNSLTTLNLSKNIKLRNLNYGSNNIKSIDISNNKNLYRISCRFNRLSVEELNALFRSLPEPADGEKLYMIDIMYNEGTDTCDWSIAEERGWDVYVNYGEAG